MTAPGLAVEGIGKSFGAVRAVDDLSFAVRPGAVTGFLGPNGSGKTTTLRMLLGLTRPSQGRALVGDRPLRRPPGAGLGRRRRPRGVQLPPRPHRARAPRGVRRAGRREQGPVSRADRVRRPGGTRRIVGSAATRWGCASGSAWRPRCWRTRPRSCSTSRPTASIPRASCGCASLLRAFADEGRTVLVSSHVLTEVQHTVDDVVIIARGRLVHASSLSELGALAQPETYVESPAPEQLAALCRDRGLGRSAHEGAGAAGARHLRGGDRRRGVRRRDRAAPARQPRAAASRTSSSG